MMSFLLPNLASFGNLDDFFGGDRSATSATFFVQEAENLSKRVGVRGIPKKRAIATNVDEADLLQLFKVMGKSGSWYFEFVLDFAGDHARGVSGKQKPHDL